MIARHVWMAAALIASSIVGADTAHAVFPTGAAGCSIAKMRASTKAFSCLVREGSKELRGKTSDVARCAVKLTGGFAKQDAKGQCPTTNDSALVLGRVQNATDGVFEDLEAATATPAQIPCVLSKAKLAVRYAKCQTVALGKRIGWLYVGDGNTSDFQGCKDSLANGFLQVEGHEECATTGSAAVQDTTAEAYGYMPGVDWGTGDIGSHMFYASGAPLPRGYLRDNDLHDAWMTNCNLAGADLTGSDLRNTVWQFSDLTGADLSAVDLSDAGIAHYTIVQDANLGTANLTYLRATGISGCPASMPAGWECRGSFLVGPMADLSSTSMGSIDLSGVDLSGALLSGTVLTGANLSGALLVGAHVAAIDLKGASLVASDLTGAEGLYCELDGANLSGADLTNADLRYGSATGANFTGASFASADLTGILFAGATLTGVDWTGTICPDQTTAAPSCCGHLLDTPAACSP